VADEIVDRIDDRSARGIAAALGRMITDGSLPPGTRLPTVRDLARRLGTSPTTVSEAWQTLARVGAIEAHGRSGTFVLDGHRPLGPRRYRRITEGPGHFALDLSTGTPDPDLLPDLGPALARVSRQNLTTSYLDDPVLPTLEETLRARWPFAPEMLTVVDGAMDALDRVASVVVRLGDRVLVENPCFPPLLDLLETLGTEPIGLDLDDEGLRPESLAVGLTHAPTALFLQPRAHNPAGVGLSAGRARKLAALLRGTDVIVVEDDHAGDIAAGPLVSLGSHRPAQTVHIRSFSKSHGPDLRLAAVGGAGDIVHAVVNRRLLGPGWSSRLLQALLVELLHDEHTVDSVARARRAYAERRAAFSAALAERAVTTSGTDGINLWIEVADERSALVTLAARGVGVAPGTPFVVRALPTDHVRLTVGQVHGGGVEALADQVMLAAAGGPPRRGRAPR
jgi:DNA-binding transcriptional MocR family regulator